MRDNYDVLKTEGRNPRTMDIDKLSSLEMVRLINQENRAVEEAIDEKLDEIAAAVDMISEAILSDMSEGDYLGAFSAFADQCDYYLGGYINGFPFQAGKNLLIALIDF